MKSFKSLMREKLSEGHDRYPGDDMTQKELKIAINSAKNILEMIDDGAPLMRWQISAIVKASDELASVCTTMRADEDEDDMSYDEYGYPSMYGEEIDTHKTKEGKTAKKGLWYNIHQRRKKGLPRKKPGDEGYPETLDI